MKQILMLDGGSSRELGDLPCLLKSQHEIVSYSPVTSPHSFRWSESTASLVRDTA